MFQIRETWLVSFSVLTWFNSFIHQPFVALIGDEYSDRFGVTHYVDGFILLGNRLDQVRCLISSEIADVDVTHRDLASGRHHGLHATGAFPSNRSTNQCRMGVATRLPCK